MPHQRTHSDGRQAEKDAQHHLSVGITNSQSEVPLRSRQTGFDTNTPSTSKNVKEQFLSLLLMETQSSTADSKDRVSSSIKLNI